MPFQLGKQNITIIYDVAYFVAKFQNNQVQNLKICIFSV